MAREGIEGTGNGHNRDPSVTADGHVLMTLRGQGPYARVGQGPRVSEVERHVPPIASCLVEVGGEAVHPGPWHVR